MKKIFVLITALIMASSSFGQEPKYEVNDSEVVFTHIIEETGLSIKDTHNALEAYFADFYNDVNSTCKLNQENHLIYKGLFSISDQGFNTYTKAEHTLDIAIKDGRVRIKIIADKMIFRGGTRGVYDYMIVNAAPINDGKQPFNVTKKMAIGFFDKLCNIVNSTFIDIENVLKSGVDNSEDDW